MKSLLVRLDDSTYQALSRIALANGRRPSQFVRDAVGIAVRQAEYAAMRAAYEAQPDSEADDWSSVAKGARRGKS
jgi:predicted transcriptional regulator